MKKSLFALAGVLAGATILVAGPASAHDRIGFGISVGVPVAPIGYVAPPPYYGPGPVVVGGPVVTVGAPYYYGGYYHGYRGDYGYRGGYRGWHR